MYVQKVKHLEYDNGNTMNSISMESDMQQNEEKNGHQAKKDKLLQNKRILESQLLKTKILNENEIKQIEQQFNEREQTVHNEFEDNFVNLNKKYEIILQDLQKELNLQTKLQVHAIEEKK
eukprot:66942_1